MMLFLNVGKTTGGAGAEDVVGVEAIQGPFYK
jgi:hypothetical protein